MKVVDIILKYLSIFSILSLCLILCGKGLEKNIENKFKNSVKTVVEYIPVHKSETMLKAESDMKNISAFIQEHYNKNETYANNVAKEIVFESESNNIDPYLVASVISAESSYNHKAISMIGAIGLMQVMPFWKEEIGNKKDNLEDITTNIRYGCKILSQYIERYDNNIVIALSAYNGSKGSMKYPNKIQRHQNIILEFNNKFKDEIT